MTAGRVESQRIKIRRKGRHTSPSQVEKVAVQAGRAAPALAIAGALVTVPQAQHATAATAQPAANAVPGVKTFAKSAYYRVRPGDTLGKIARNAYGRTSDWQWLYHENDNKLSDPDTIFPGQEIFVPADPPDGYTLPDYRPRHARPAAASGGDSDGTSGGSVVTQSARHGRHSSHSGSGHSSLSGTLGCGDLERLWEEAGGDPSDAFTAAEIAMAESGGNQYAVSPTDDYGYWQINSSNGPLATFSAYGNARAAVVLSGNGANWAPWTTYTSGAYAGRC